MTTGPGGGEILRRWRESVASASQQDVASAAGRSDTAVYEWERGKSTPSPNLVRAVDEALDAGGTLAGLFHAAGTPDAISPRRIWEHNYPHALARQPVWLWIRHHDQPRTRVKAVLEWGPLRHSVRLKVTSEGGIINMPASLANPQLIVELSRPGWVDFGVGTVPAELGVPVTEGLARGILIDRLHDVVRKTRQYLARTEGNPWKWIEDIQPALRDTFKQWFSPSRAEERASNDEPDLDISRSVGGTAPSWSPWSGTELMALRDARGLSRTDVANELRRMLDEVGDHTATPSDHVIETLERGSNPRDPLARAMLDQLYAADGYTCCVSTGSVEEEIDVDEHHAEMLFPAWWVGPVWLRFLCEGRKEVRVVTVRWHGWEQHVKVRSGQTVTFRQAFTGGHLEPVSVTAPSYWRIEAGTGRHEDAHDINVGWKVTAGSVEESAIQEAERAFLQACGLVRLEGVEEP